VNNVCGKFLTIGSVKGKLAGEWSLQDLKVDLESVAVSVGEMECSWRPVKLFSRPDFDDRQPQGWPSTFDVTDDGERFLTTELVTGDKFDPGIAIIQNWASSLEQD
jgi:hypothetical protein